MRVMGPVLLAILLSLPAGNPSYAQPAIERPRDVISVAASAPAQRFADALSAAFAVRLESPQPVVELAPAHEAFEAFCAKADSQPDVVVSHRRMSHAELARCRHADVGDIVEIP